MKTYPRDRSSPGKWVFAGVLFILSVTFFTAEANAFNFPYSPNGPNGSGQINGTVSEQHLNVVPNGPATDPPFAVPEPTTLLLMASGLGMVFWNRRSKQA